MTGLTVSGRDLATIALRVMGLLYLLDALRAMPSWISLFSMDVVDASGFDPAALALRGLLGIAVSAAFGLFFLFRTGTLVRWFFSDLSESQDTSAAELQTAAIALIGLFLAAWFAVGLLSGSVRAIWYLEGSRQEYLGAMAEQEMPAWVTSALGVAVGVALFRGADWLRRKIPGSR